MAWTGHLVLLNTSRNNEATLIDHNVKITIGINRGRSEAPPAKLPCCRASGEEAILMLTPMPDKDFDMKLGSTELAEFPISVKMTTLGGYVRLSKLRRIILGDEVVASELEDAFLVLSRGPENACDATMTYNGILYMAGRGEFKVSRDRVNVQSEEIGDATLGWIGCSTAAAGGTKTKNLDIVHDEKQQKKLIAPARLFPAGRHEDGDRKEDLAVHASEQPKKGNSSHGTITASECLSVEEKDSPGSILVPSSLHSSDYCSQGETGDNLAGGVKVEQNPQLLAGCCIPVRVRRPL
ncbi:unnamed protein product [Sphagnum tenellum]